MTRLLPAIAAAAFVFALISRAPGAEDATEDWGWLAGAPSGADDVRWGPSLTDGERARAEQTLGSVLTLAVSAPEQTPSPEQADGTAFVVREDGLVATNWRTIADTSASRWLWARARGDRWHRVIPMGGTWWTDVGLGRLVSLPRRWPPVRWGEVDRESVGDRFVAIGTPRHRPHVVTAGRLASLVYLEADAATGPCEVRGRAGESCSPEATLVALRFDGAISTDGGAGSPVFDANGACVGFVGEPRNASEGVVVRAAPLVRPVLESIARDAAFDPPDLGLRFVPIVRTVPEDVLAARRHARGGALVESVFAEGPANRLLWEGDVVVAIEGRRIFGEFPESLALALLRLTPTVPADVVVVRGGAERRVEVPPTRARTLRPSFQAEHDAQGRAALGTD